MKKLLNTLYVTLPSAYLSKDGTNVVVSSEGEEVFRIPIMNVESICTFGYQGASPGLMHLCAENGVSLSFFTPRGRFVARVTGPVRGNILLRAQQFNTIHNSIWKLNLSRLFIIGKLFNSRVILRRFVREHPSSSKDVGVVAEHLKYLISRVEVAEDVEQVRGYEGEGANRYFSVFSDLILNQDPTFAFNCRSRRPPKDIVNAMLSMGYAMLANDCASALEGVGLDPAAGYMHSLRPGRYSLALDLMEELRAFIVDRFVIALINTKQISANDFKVPIESDSGLESGVYFTDSGLKKFLSAWQSRKKIEITHPFLEEKIQLGLLPHVQALLLARFLRGDLDTYPVFLAR